VDPQQTVILHSADDAAGFYCNVPVTLSVFTRDQHGVTAAVSNLRVSQLYSLYWGQNQRTDESGKGAVRCELLMGVG